MLTLSGKSVCGANGKMPGKPLLTSKNLNVDGSINLDNVNYISDEDFESINKRSGVNVGDILFGMIGTIGNPAIVKSNGFAIKNVALVKVGPNLINSFLLQYLKSDLTIRQFHILNTGNTQKFISLNIIRSLKVLLPLIEEQQKIANFLSRHRHQNRKRG
jgi:type I restriction enzyme S subunit